MSSVQDQAIYRSKQWRNLRPAIFERDGYRCKISGPKCTTTATQVDHIVPMSQGGAPFDPDNLRAACRACNVRRSNQRSEAWRHAATKIMLVVGPPFAGKSRWVAEHAGPHDFVVDYDMIAARLNVQRGDDAMHDVVAAARSAMLRRAQQGATGSEVAWIVSANPDAEAMFPHHEVVLVDPGVAECAARCAGVVADAGATSRVRAWYQGRRSIVTSDSGDSSSSRVW